MLVCTGLAYKIATDCYELEIMLSFLLDKKSKIMYPEDIMGFLMVHL